MLTRFLFSDLGYLANPRGDNKEDSITFIVLGSVVIVGSFFIKNFYAGRGTFGASVSDRRIPTWVGRLLAVVVGSMMVLSGLSYFIFPHD